MFSKPELLNCHVTVVRLQEAEEPLVIGWRQIEELGNETITAARARASHPHSSAHRVSHQIALHERIMDHGPERFGVIRHLPKTLRSHGGHQSRPGSRRAGRLAIRQSTAYLGERNNLSAVLE